MTEKTFISVILPLKLEWEPCYSCDTGEGPVCRGDRARVLFAGKEYIGVVSDTSAEPSTDKSKIRSIIGIERSLKRISDQEIRLWKNVAEYYMCSIGEVYKAAYPAGKISLEETGARADKRAEERRHRIEESLMVKKARQEERRKRAIASLMADKEKLTERISRKREALDIAEAKAGKARSEAVRERQKEVISRYKKDISGLQENLHGIIEKSKALETAEMLKNEAERPATLPEKTTSGIATEAHESTASGTQCIKRQEYSNITLSDVQRKARIQINEAFGKRKTVLLKGVTGSGKTAIYTDLAIKTIGEGRNVLYLVPEIALSRQLEDRLRKTFGESLLTFHSGETMASRRNTASIVRERKGYIVLGTRSALFLPHNNLGLVIVDEEHDSSYKQDSPAPRYNGRDTAVMLGSIHGSNVLLGSATPSLESIYNCKTGKYSLVELNERYHGEGHIDTIVIDIIAERKKRGMTGNLSKKLIAMIGQTLAKGEQAVILRSRRAYSPIMQCTGCGHVPKCPHCNVSLSYHKDKDRMECHYCGYSQTFSGSCPKCGEAMLGMGSGTQKIEEELNILFPEASVARLDSDSIQDRKYEADTIRKFAKGEIDILIGTQIVTKGFDFSNLTLVAVIQSDAMLAMQDFRADEKALQLLEQFKGRCARRGRKGIFAIQTCQPEHPVYQKIIKTDTEDMSMLHERKEFGYPPYFRIIDIIVKDIYEDRAIRMSSKLAAILSAGGTDVLGPYPPAVSKVAGRHIRIIRISLGKDKTLSAKKTALERAVRDFEKKERYDGHISVDVDPI